MNTYDFNNKTALITGANRGIGEGFVHTLIKAGVKKVYAASRDLDNLKPLIAQYPTIIEAVQLDVTNQQQIDAMASQIDDLDILVNNAGIAIASLFAQETALEIAKQEMEVNYFAPMNITHAVLAKLKVSSQALIFNLSSIAGLSYFPNIATYSASKAAMHILTQGLRCELAEDNIKVVGIYPGPIDTRMAEGFEIEKPKPEQVAIRAIDALNKQKYDVFPDDFSENMFSTFLEHPTKLEATFSSML